MSKQSETAVLVMSDQHYGKETASYSPAVYRRRMKKLARSLAQIRDLLGGGYSIDRLVIFQLGDANDGTGIYATQEHHQAITNVEMQAEELARHDADWLRGQREIWGKVEVEAVPGNHGRSGWFAHEAASWDVVYYRYLGLMLDRDRIPVRLNRDGDVFLRKVELRGHQYLLYHGHAIRMYQTIPWYGIQIRVTRWATTGLSPIDVVCMGHFHTYGSQSINRVRALLTGTMATDDDWALQTIGYESQARWRLFGVSRKRAVTWSFGLDLE